MPPTGSLLVEPIAACIADPKCFIDGVVSPSIHVGCVDTPFRAAAPFGMMTYDTATRQ